MCWFRACLTQTAHIQTIFGHFSAILGRIVELEGKKGLLGTGQSRRTWSVATVSLRLAVLSGFRGPFGLKTVVLGLLCCCLLACCLLLACLLAC